MTGRAYFNEHFRDFPFRIDDEGVARGKLYSLVLHHRAILLRNLRVGIRQQFEVETFLSAETLVRLSSVYTHAEYYGLCMIVFVQVALEIMSLERAATSEVFGVEIEHHPMALEILEAGFLAFVCY